MSRAALDDLLTHALQKVGQLGKDVLPKLISTLIQKVVSEALGAAAGKISIPKARERIDRLVSRLKDNDQFVDEFLKGRK